MYIHSNLLVCKTFKFVYIDIQTTDIQIINIYVYVYFICIYVYTNNRYTNMYISFACIFRLQTTFKFVYTDIQTTDIKIINNSFDLNICILHLHICIYRYTNNRYKYQIYVN